MLHNPELRGHSVLSGPVLALFCCLCLAAFLIPALRAECPCPSRDVLSHCLGLQPCCPSSWLLQLSRAWSKAEILHSFIWSHFSISVYQSLETDFLEAQTKEDFKFPQPCAICVGE